VADRNKRGQKNEFLTTDFRKKACTEGKSPLSSEVKSFDKHRPPTFCFFLGEGFLLGGEVRRFVR